MRNMHDTIATVMICESIRTFLGLRSKRGLGLKGRVAVLGPLLIVVNLGRSAALHGWRGRGGSTWASDLDPGLVLQHDKIKLSIQIYGGSL